MFLMRWDASTHPFASCIIVSGHSTATQTTTSFYQHACLSHSMQYYCSVSNSECRMLCCRLFPAHQSTDPRWTWLKIAERTSCPVEFNNTRDGGSFHMSFINMSLDSSRVAIAMALQWHCNGCMAMRTACL